MPNIAFPECSLIPDIYQASEILRIQSPLVDLVASVLTITAWSAAKAMKVFGD